MEWDTIWIKTLKKKGSSMKLNDHWGILTATGTSTLGCGFRQLMLIMTPYSEVQKNTRLALIN